MPEPMASAEAALAALAGLDLDGVPDESLTRMVLEFQRLRGALDAAEARVLARWDASKVWRGSGAKTAAAYLAWKQRLPVQVARQRLRHARAVRDFPAVETAWATGEIDRSHLTTLFGVRTARTQASFEAEHDALLDAARTRRYVDFKRTCDLWEQLVDPDGAEQDADEDRAAREVHLSQSFGGMYFGRLTLDPVSGSIVADTLAAIERELFDADWADAKARLGREPLIVELGRTPAQRRADALVEMATRARTAPADGRRPAPLFTVLVGYETLAGPVLELANRTTVTPGTAARWLDGADLERVVFDTPTRVIDVGVTRRLYRGGLRRAIEVRDRTCFHESCDEVPERPEIDHVDPYSAGGLTTEANGRLACAFHNRWRTLQSAGLDPPDP